MTIYSLMYSFSYLEPVCCSMSSSNCIQMSQEAGKVVWYSHLFKNFLQFIVIHTVKGFGIVNKAEIDVFLELPCFFHHLQIWQFDLCSSAFSKSSLNIWKFTVHILLKPHMKNFEHFFASVWDECNCVVVWAFFGIAFLWDWNEHRPFPVLWPLLSFPNLLAYWVQHFHSIIISWKYPTILKTSPISSSRAKSASFSPLSSFQCISKVSSYSSIGFNWGCMHAWVLCHFSGMLPHAL